MNLGLELQVRAMRAIGMGDELSLNYIHLDYTKFKRQSVLKKKYLIDCKCDKCVHNLDTNVNYDELKDLIDRVLVDCHFGIWAFDRDMKCVTHLVSIYGDFHPLITAHMFVTLFLIIITDKKHLFDEKTVKELIQRVDNAMKVTHGLNHKLYKTFIEMISHFE
jgi:hypothetical protein